VATPQSKKANHGKGRRTLLHRELRATE